MWWDDTRIESVVSRHFVCSQLLPEEIARLDRPVGFGDGLTNESYWEWIDGKAKKIFLILVDLGVPDQIFGLVDDSWDDDDLPIALDQVDRLALTEARDERLERKFFYRQFHYLLKPLQQGRHMVYQDLDVIPIDVVEKRPGLTSSQHIDKVTVHKQSGKLFCRRRIPVGSGPGSLSHEDLQYHIDSIKNLQNEHLVSYWGSYTQHGYAYLLFTPASDASIKSLLANTPATIKGLDKDVRRKLMLNWILCLVDTLCFLHSKELSHGQIKPSTVLLNAENHISYSDCNRSALEKLSSGSDGTKTSFDKESYDYGAPEQWARSSTGLSTSPTSRRGSILSPVNSFSSMDGGTIISPVATNFDQTTTSFSIRGAEVSAAATMHHFNSQLNPQAADVFSLGCIILEILTFLLKKQTKAFAAHRAAKHKTPGRGGAVPDSSFHKNLGQVENWMTSLAKDAAAKAKKETKDNKKTATPAMTSTSSSAKLPPPPAFTFFRSIAPLLHVVERMLAPNSAHRPTAFDVQRRVYQILREQCGIMEPHCVHQYEAVKPPPSPTRSRMPTARGFYGRADREDVLEEDEEDYEVIIGIPYKKPFSSKRSSGQSSGRQSHGRSDSGGSDYWSGSGSGGVDPPLSPRDIRGSDARDFGGRGREIGYEDGYSAGYGNAYLNGYVHGQLALRPGGHDMVMRSPVFASRPIDARAGL